MSEDLPIKRGILLRALSDEVSRIAGSLARLSVGVGDEDQLSLPAKSEHETIVDAESIRWLIEARRSRARYVSSELLGDPAWDILLDLLRAELTDQRVSVSSACLASGAPPTTGLRWLSRLEKRGLILREQDQRDGRRVFVRLSENASQMLRRYVADVVHHRASSQR